MLSFKTWLEASNIQVLNYNKQGDISFAVGGKVYKFWMDAGYFYNGFFARWLKHAPGKAFNYAVKHAEQVSKPEPKPERPYVQKTLF